MDESAEIFFEHKNGRNDDPLFKVILTPEKITYLRKKAQNTDQTEWMPIAIAEKDAERFIIYPKFGVDHQDDDAYSNIKRISFEISADEFEDLRSEPFVSDNRYPDSLSKEIVPFGLGRYFTYGLRIPQKYNTLIKAIEAETTCTQLFVSHEYGLEINNHILRIGRSNLENHCKKLDRQGEMANRVARRFKERTSNNYLREATGEEELDYPRFRTPATNIAAQAFKDSHVSDDDFDEISEMFVKHFPQQSRKYTKKILKFHEELLIKSLKSVITEAEKLMDEGAQEKKWQSYFDDYHIVLQQLFHAPIEVLHKEGTLRPPTASGSGARITDFLSVNSATRNVVLVEVKTPATKLMAPEPYRGGSGAEVYAIHSSLAGAVAQLQSQLVSARLHLPSLPQDPSSPEDIHYEGSLIGALIVGRISDLNPLQRTSFTLFRETMHKVEIVTYDELIIRLKNLHHFLESLQKSPDETS